MGRIPEMVKDERKNRFCTVMTEAMGDQSCLLARMLLIERLGHSDIECLGNKMCEHIYVNFRTRNNQTKEWEEDQREAEESLRGDSSVCVRIIKAGGRRWEESDVMHGANGR